ncbi:hypothetical protein ABPG74_011076 [Tetrahymena malaccensis]
MFEQFHQGVVNKQIDLPIRQEFQHDIKWVIRSFNLHLIHTLHRHHLLPLHYLRLLLFVLQQQVLLLKLQFLLLHIHCLPLRLVNYFNLLFRLTLKVFLPQLIQVLIHHEDEIHGGFDRGEFLRHIARKIQPHITEITNFQKCSCQSQQPQDHYRFHHGLNLLPILNKYIFLDQVIYNRFIK